MITIAADPKHLGAQIGLTAVLHTWGSALTHHPHAHIIVPGGGFSPEPAPAQAGGQHWIACRPRFLLAVPVLSRLFRRLFLEKLTAAYHTGRLQFFADQAALAEPAAFKAWLAALRKLECRVDGGVTVPIPHRPGRADFPHPVLHERGSLTAAYPWRILTEGSGWRARSALKRAHGTTPPRCRRDNHLRQTRTT